MQKCRTYKLLGGARHGETFRVDPGMGHLVVPVYEEHTLGERATAKPFRTELYRREKFGVSDAGFIEVFVHESWTQKDMAVHIFGLLVKAMGAEEIPSPS